MAALSTRHIEPLLPGGPGRAFQKSGFQDQAFQNLESAGAFQNTAFDDEGFQEDSEAFLDTAFQGDAFQQDELVLTVVLEAERPIVLTLQAVNRSSVF